MIPASPTGKGQQTLRLGCTPVGVEALGVAVCAQTQGRDVGGGHSGRQQASAQEAGQVKGKMSGRARPRGQVGRAGTHGRRYLAPHLIATGADRRPKNREHLAGEHRQGVECSLGHASDGPAPTRVDDPQAGTGWVHHEHRQAVGGEHAEQETRRRPSRPGIAHGPVPSGGGAGGRVHHPGAVHLVEQGQPPHAQRAEPTLVRLSRTLVPQNPGGKPVHQAGHCCQEGRGEPRPYWRRGAMRYAAGMWQRILIMCAVWLAMGAPGAQALEPPPTLASLVGERLEFRVRWGVITAAQATLEVLDAGQGTIKLRAVARTAAVVDAIYPVRDQIDSTVTLPGGTVARYFKTSKEGWGKSRRVEVLFDPAAGTSRYFKDGEFSRLLLVPPGVQDPLSSFYAYRTREIPLDEDVALDITDGKKLVVGVTSVLGREVVETPAGRFSTVRIEPKIEGIGGIFKKSPGARVFIWLTDDRWRRPVKMQSKVVVGHFTAELVKVVPPTGP